MAWIKLLDKESNVVEDNHERTHDKTSLQPLPRILEESGKRYRFDHYEGVVTVYKESNI